MDPEAAHHDHLDCTTLPACAPELGGVQSAGEPIINGTVVANDTFGVARMLSKPGCSGAVLNNRWILTAEHCIHDVHWADPTSEEWSVELLGKTLRCFGYGNNTFTPGTGTGGGTLRQADLTVDDVSSDDYEVVRNNVCGSSGCQAIWEGDSGRPCGPSPKRGPA